MHRDLLNAEYNAGNFNTIHDYSKDLGLNAEYAKGIHDLEKQYRQSERGSGREGQRERALQRNNRETGLVIIVIVDPLSAFKHL